MKRRCRQLGWSFGLLLSISLLHADELIVDQHNEFDASGLAVPFYSLKSGSPLGQEFIPASNSVSFVSLVTSGGGWPSANLQVLIHPDTITSPVLGASDPVLLTNSMSIATNHFRFIPSVPVVVGRTYVMEVVIVDTGFSIWGVAASVDTYSKGAMILQGQPNLERDLWFREGAVVPALDSPLLSIRISHVEVSWSSSVGKTYQVQYRSDLTTNLWTDIGLPVSGNGLTNSVTCAISVSEPRRFYRVLILP